MKIQALLFSLALALLAGFPLVFVGAALLSVSSPQVVGIVAALLAMAVALAAAFWIRRRHDHTGHGVAPGWR